MAETGQVTTVEPCHVARRIRCKAVAPDKIRSAFGLSGSFLPQALWRGRAQAVAPPEPYGAIYGIQILFTQLLDSFEMQPISPDRIFQETAGELALELVSQMAGRLAGA